MKDKKSIRILHKKAWDIFSKYIRQRDGGKCFTCPAKDDPKEMNAGHFHHRDCLDFDERNVNCQCVHCNKYLRGNLDEYAYRLNKKYGQKVMDELYFLKHQVRKFTTIELENIIEKYKEKLEDLQKGIKD